MDSKRLKVLLVTPDSRLRDQFERMLRDDDFSINHMPSGEKALEQVWQDAEILLLLHLELAGMSALDVLRIVREDARSRKIPVLCFSTQPDQAKILTAFNLETDDYLAAPFHPEEVIARIKAVLNRRLSRYREGDALTKGKIQVHLAHHRVTCNGADVGLTRKEYELLVLLLKKEGRVLSRQYLLETIWEASKEITTRSVDMLVARLRKKLGREGARWIETVQGYGYRIVAE